MDVIAILHKCSRRGCSKLTQGDKYCKLHKDTEQERYKEYKMRKKNDEEYKKANDFYNKDSWIRLRNYMRNKYLGLCIVCWAKGKTVDLYTIHHVEELRDKFDRGLDASNLIAVCSSCHKRIHDEYLKGTQEKMNMQKILFGLVKKFEEELGRK